MIIWLAYNPYELSFIFIIICICSFLSIKYISLALLFNKTFCKHYIYVTSSLFLILADLILVDVIINRVVSTCNLQYWFGIDLLMVNWEYQVDSSSGIMLGVVAVISSVVHVYSLD